MLSASLTVIECCSLEDEAHRRAANVDELIVGSRWGMLEKRRIDVTGNGERDRRVILRNAVLEAILKRPVGWSGVEL